MMMNHLLTGSEFYVIINKMHSFKKEGDQLVKKIKDQKETLLFGISFSRPPNTLVLYKQHLYSMYLLLYKYGENNHKKRFMNMINKFLTELSIKVERHNHVCIPSETRLECIQNLKMLGLLQMFNFVKEDMNDTKKQITFHAQKERNKLRKIFKYIFQQQKKPIEKSYMNLFDYAQLTGSLLRLQCQTREFYNFQLVEFKCESFYDNNIEVFIEIDRISNTYRYVKQKRLDIFSNNGEEAEKIAKSAMKYSIFSTDAYNNMRYVESQTEQVRYEEEQQSEYIQSVVAVSKEHSMQQNVMVGDDEQEELLQSRVLASRKSHHNQDVGVGISFIDKSSLQDCHSAKQEEVDLLQSIHEVMGKRKQSNSNTLVVSQGSKEEVYEEQSFTERFDVDKEMQKLQAPQYIQSLKVNRIQRSSQTSRPLEETGTFKAVVSKIENEKAENSKKQSKISSSKGSKANRQKKAEEFQTSYVVKRPKQFLDQLFSQQNIQVETFVIALHEEFNPSKFGKNSSVKQKQKAEGIEKSTEKKAKQYKKQAIKQQNLLSTKESKKPSQQRAKQEKQGLAESSKSSSKQSSKQSSQPLNFRKSTLLANTKSIEKQKELKHIMMLKKTESKILQTQKVSEYGLEKLKNPQVIRNVSIDSKTQSKELVHSNSLGNVIRLSKEKNIVHRYQARMTVCRDSSLTKPQRQQFVSK